MSVSAKDEFQGQTPREFHLGDVISAYHGILVSPRGVDGIYDILDFLTGESLMTHHLPTAAEFCKPFIKYQFPEIAEINAKIVPSLAEKADGSDKRDAVVKTWLNDQAQAYGEKVALRPLTPEEKTGFEDYMIENSLLKRLGSASSSAPKLPGPDSAV